MKIEELNEHFIKNTGVNIYIDEDSDYPILDKLIKNGDIIETKIRRKDKSLKNPVFYAIVELLVEQTEYTKEPSETIHVVGKVTNSDHDNIKEGTKQSFWITDGCELRLMKEKWEDDDMDLINELLHPSKNNEEHEKLTSPKELQDKCFDLLHKYMVKKCSYVTYGNEVFESLENGAIKVLFITEEFIDRQNEKWKNILSSEDHKYHGANIVVYDKESSNWEELTNFGGIIGVLKYYYVPSSEYDSC